MGYWKKLSKEQCLERVRKALSENVDFGHDATLGYPASRLDGKVFYSDAPFLKDAPTLQTFVANPNHIGCHTMGESESAFKGTHVIEREALTILAVDVFHAEADGFDGYIAPGGTEANIQAIWMYRNYFMRRYGALLHEIVILASEDTHYSIAKAANLLMLDRISVPVDFATREVRSDAVEKAVLRAMDEGKKYVIAIANMGTTMFGSVDNPVVYTDIFRKYGLTFSLHVDGAYGGFVYPFHNEEHSLHFGNPDVGSITIDAHKMLQAPYGTGIFLCRKGMIENVLTQEAQYVEGMDVTLCGSRSGANAIAVWMILSTYGPHGWFEKISVLQMRTAWLCNQLQQLGVKFFREKRMNIVTIRAEYITPALAHKYDLVPDSHNHQPKWYKIVLMDHAEIEHLSDFIHDLQQTLIAETV